MSSDGQGHDNDDKGVHKETHLSHEVSFSLGKNVNFGKTDLGHAGKQGYKIFDRFLNASAPVRLDL